MANLGRSCWRGNGLCLDRHLSLIQSQMLALLLAQHVVHADDAVWPRGSSVVHDSGIGLDPNPATVFGEEAVIFSRHLALIDYCKRG